MSTHALHFTSRISYAADADGIDIPISLSLGNESVELAAKLDTGASDCIFERSVGEQLGLTIESGHEQHFRTATGSFRAYGHTVLLRCEPHEFHVMAYFAAEAEFSRNVLGRRGWLEQVRLGLVDYDRVLYLSRYGDQG